MLLNVFEDVRTCSDVLAHVQKRLKAFPTFSGVQNTENDDGDALDDDVDDDDVDDDVDNGDDMSMTAKTSATTKTNLRQRQRGPKLKTNVAKQSKSVPKWSKASS